jgi:putative membrane protein
MTEDKSASNVSHDSPSNDPRIYFAQERTFLAWIRTGLGLMGVGFAVSRFGLFLREMRASETHVTVHATGVSEYSGVAIVALGVIVNVAAVVQHVRTVRELREGTWVAGRISTNAVVLALLLAVVGLGMGAYLLYLR